MGGRTTSTDWEGLDSMADEDIDTSDIPELGEDFFKEAMPRLPTGQSGTLEQKSSGEAD